MNRLASRLVSLVRSLAASDRQAATIAISAVPRIDVINFGIADPTSMVVPVVRIPTDTVLLTTPPQGVTVRIDDLPTVVSAGVAPTRLPAAPPAGPLGLVAKSATGPAQASPPFTLGNAPPPASAATGAPVVAAPGGGWPSISWSGGVGAAAPTSPDGGVGGTTGDLGVGVPLPLQDKGMQGGTHLYLGTASVPVGLVPTFALVVPQGKAIATVTWSGGSAFSGYFSTDAASPAPVSMTVAGPPVTDESDYTFVLDADARAYDVHVVATYTAATGGGGGTCDVDFTTARPSATMAVGPPAPGIALDTSVTNQQVPPGDVAIAVNPVMQFQATTASNGLAGTFMFMQLVNIDRSQYNTGPPNPSIWSRQNSDPPYDGPLIDDGKTVSYEWRTPPSKIYLFDWHLTANAPENVMPQAGQPPPQMNDMPRLVSPNTWVSMSVFDSFSTFVMYQPDSTALPTVWVALAEADWEYGGSASNDGTGVWTLAGPDVPLPVFSTPSGGAAFPVWVNLSANYFNENINPYLPQPLQ